MFTTSMLCSGVFLLIGLGIIFSGWLTYRKSNQAAGWIPASGKVITSEVRRTSGSDLKFFAHIVYQFMAGGMEYISRNVTFAQLMGILDTAKPAALEKVKKFPAGSMVTVYYDPENPNRSVLEKGGDSSLFFLGGIFVLFGIVIWFLG